MTTVPTWGCVLPFTVILAVGLDSWLQTTPRSVWQSAGYFITSAGSIGEAIDSFRCGDFDLVLMGDSITVESRERLTFLIRSTGSGTPVVCLENDSGGREGGFAHATFKSKRLGVTTDSG
jgi:hypothetical protein